MNTVSKHALHARLLEYLRRVEDTGEELIVTDIDTHQALVRARVVAVSCALALAGCTSPPPARSSPPPEPTPDPVAASPEPAASESEPPEPGADITAPPDSAEPTPAALTPRPLGELYASVAEFRKQHPLERDAACGPPTTKLPKSKLVRTGARAPIKSAEIVRLPADMACAPIERCSLAIQTDKGWYIAASDETCAGVVGPAQRVSRHSERLSFADAGQSVVLEYRYSTTHVRTSKSGEDRHDTAWLVVCGIGESQLPSCTEPIAVSCADADGAVTPVSWAHTAGTFTLESSANPDACERESLILGSYPLTFP